MRNIIFRGRSISHHGKKEEWVYGFYSNYKGVNGRTHYISSDNGNSIAVRGETVGQYTGLTDKDGNRIFEGDIVECVSWNEYFSDPTTGKVMEPFRRKMEVVFMAGGFKLVEHLPQPCKDNVWNMIIEGDLTVIGNIHDNPELLN